MKKCKGCGAILQIDNPSKVGYCLNLEQDYCQRCFRLTHYGDLKNFNNGYVTNEKIFKIYEKHQNGLFVLIVDALEALVLEDDDLLDYFKNYHVLLIINKTDILPINMKDEKINDIYVRLLKRLAVKYPNIKYSIMSNKYETNFNDEFFNLLNQLSYEEIIFVGRANAGKSTLINKLLHTKDLTTSLYPRTTLDENIIYYENYKFIDTPGLIDLNNYSEHLDKEKYKLIKIDETTKPQIFQVYEAQSYFYEGLLRIDYLPNKKGSISFYINNMNKIHRTSCFKADEYYERNYERLNLKVKELDSFEENIDNFTSLFIKGLGFIKIKGKGKIRIHLLKDIKVYHCEVNI